MSNRPALFKFMALPNAAAAEAAARRRMRSIETAYPAVLEWHVAAALREAAGEAERFEAVMRAAIRGGSTLEARACGTDVLGALRLAFNSLEAELQAEAQDARDRAAAWLATVRRRLGVGSASC